MVRGVRQSVFWGAAVAWAIIAGAASAAAQAGHWIGDWQQLDSNAGQCRSCRVAITGDGRTLTVTANNGWTARVAAGIEHGLAAARGEGKWDGARTKALADATFHIHLVERGMRLHMAMRVATSGRMRVIRAVFGRAWVGA